MTPEQAERLIAAIERCAEALELLSTAYVHRALSDDEDFVIGDLADTQEDLVQKKWSRPTTVP
jgi:hypothetical protein